MVVVNEYKCGCKIITEKHCSSIEYCPLHKGAPKLLEALKGIMNDYPLAHYTGHNHPCPHCTALEAIAEAEGK